MLYNIPIWLLTYVYQNTGFILLGRSGSLDAYREFSKFRLEINYKVYKSHKVYLTKLDIRIPRDPAKFCAFWHPKGEVQFCLGRWNSEIANVFADFFSTSLLQATNSNAAFLEQSDKANLDTTINNFNEDEVYAAIKN